MLRTLATRAAEELDVMCFSFLSDRKTASSGRTAEYPRRTQKPPESRTNSWPGVGSNPKIHSVRDNKDPSRYVAGEGRYELQASLWVVGSTAIIRPAS